MLQQGLHQRRGLEGAGNREEKEYQSPIVLPERKKDIFYFLEMKENVMGRIEEEERG